MKYEEEETILAPFVMDVFLLDAMTEMLQTPLRFLDYINKRAQYIDKLLAVNELTVLSYHLKQNLYLDDEFDMVQLGEDISVDLDIAMMARREGIPGAKTPDGILTHINGTVVGQLIESLQNTEDPFCVNLGLILLNIGESTIKAISDGVEKITRQTLADKQNHDLTVLIDNGKQGLTIHSNHFDRQKAYEEIAIHCEWKKYQQKADEWFGISINPITLEIKCGLHGKTPWEYDELMEKVLQESNKEVKKRVKNPSKAKKKTGRNALCPCGSGKKYKKCCLK